MPTAATIQTCNIPAIKPEYRSEKDYAFGELPYKVLSKRNFNIGQEQVILGFCPEDYTDKMLKHYLDNEIFAEHLSGLSIHDLFRFGVFGTETELNGNDVIEPPFYAGNVSILNNKVDTAFAKSPQYCTIPQIKAKKIAEKLTKELGKMQFERVAVELLQTGGILFKIILPNDYLLMVSKPFIPIPGSEEDEVVFSIFENRELILSNATKVSALVEGVRELGNS